MIADRLRAVPGVILLVVIASSLLGPTAIASDRGQVTGLTLPRFVSVKAAAANVRVGPGLGYAVKFTIVRSRLPLEIVAEFENWRRVRDWNGDEGWMLGALLSGKRTALVAPWSRAQPAHLHAAASATSQVTAILNPRVLVEIEECDGRWCEVSARDREGYVRQTALWGAYPNEVF